MLTLLRCTIVLVLVGGIALLFGALVGTETLNWPQGVIPAGVSLVVVAITALTATQAVVSWQRQRQREIEVAAWERRRAVYEPIVEDALRSFTRGTALTADELAQMRAPLAAWGTQKAIAAFGRWFAYSSRLAGKDGGAIQDEDRPEMYRRLYEALAAARMDLVDAGGRKKLQCASVDQESMMSMLFNEYRHEFHGDFVDPLLHKKR